MFYIFIEMLQLCPVESWATARTASTMTTNWSRAATPTGGSSPTTSSATSTTSSTATTLTTNLATNSSTSLGRCHHGCTTHPFLHFDLGRLSRGRICNVALLGVGGCSFSFHVGVVIGGRIFKQIAGEQCAKPAIDNKPVKKKREGNFTSCGRHDMILRDQYYTFALTVCT
jgi:hypothetical protein